MLFIKPAYASCPVCIVTVGGGLFLAKKLGIDDLLVSIWIGGLNTAIAYWLVSKIKHPRIFNLTKITICGFFVLTLFYLGYTKQLFHPGNTIFGFDKIIVGLVTGSIAIIIAETIDQLIRKYNKGKVMFYYQKVIIPVSLLLITTLIFKLLLK